MKKIYLLIFVLFAGFASWGQLSLSGTSYTQNFDALPTLPTGWTVRTGASASALGTAGTVATDTWSGTAGNFRNVAAAESPQTSASINANQNSATDRALAVRPSGSFGDPGAAFTLQIANTTGKTGFSLSLKHMLFDPQPRTTTYTVQFTTVAAGTSGWANLGTFTTDGVWGTTAGNYSFGTLLDNIAANVWIRVIALTAAAGSGNRDTYGIDDFVLSWSVAATASITTSQSALSGFNYIEGNGPSTSQSFDLSGSNLSPTDGNISLTIPTGYEVAINGGSFTDVSPATVAYTGGTLAATPISVRLKAGLSSGTYNGAITISGGTATDKTVTLSGNVAPPPPPCMAPDNQATDISFGNVTSSSISGSFTAAVGGASHYLVVVSNQSSLGADPADQTTYTAGTALGNGTVVQASVATTFTATGLSSSTAYYIFVFAYNNEACTNGPVYNITNPATGTTTTTEAPCGMESFSNSNATATYADNSFVGDNSITWTYVTSRNENSDANGSGINGKALMLRRIADGSKVTSSTIATGIGNFSVKLYKGFTGPGNRQVELYINGVSKGTSTIFDDLNEHIFAVSNINIIGDVVIELRNITANQIIVDDITWTCYDGAEFIYDAGVWTPSDPVVNATSVDNITVLTGSAPIAGNLEIKNITIADGAYIDLQNNAQLTTNGNITVGATGYIRTMGNASLKIKNVTASTTFPVGNSTPNFVNIRNSAGSDWAISVADAINVQTGEEASIQRTWQITPSTPAPGAIEVTLQYNDGDATQTGAAYSSSTNVNIWHKATGSSGNWTRLGSTSFTPAGTPGSERAVVFTTSDFSDFVITNEDVPLPIRVTNFAGQNTENGVLLSWSAKNEEIGSHYELERQTGNAGYVKIATLQSQNNSLGSAYKYEDIKVPGGSSYYRLKTVAADGSFTYSPVVRIEKIYTRTKLSIYTNPVQNQLPVLLSGPTGEGSLSIISAAGVVLRTEKVQINGSSVRNIDISQLAAGLYMLQFRSTDLNTTIKFIKQ